MVADMEDDEDSLLTTPQYTSPLLESMAMTAKHHEKEALQRPSYIWVCSLHRLVPHSTSSPLQRLLLSALARLEKQFGANLLEMIPPVQSH